MRNFVKTKRNMRHIREKSQTFSQSFCIFAKLITQNICILFLRTECEKMQSFKRTNLFCKKCELFAIQYSHILGKPNYNTIIIDYNNN